MKTTMARFPSHAPLLIMTTRRVFRRVVAVVWFALVVGVFALVGEPIWLGVVVGLMLSGAYVGMTARARAAGWLGEPAKDDNQIRLAPLALAILVALLAAAFVYVMVALIFG
jgi:hypothetical protein